MFKECGIYTLMDQKTLDKNTCVNNIRKLLEEKLRKKTDVRSRYRRRKKR